MLMLQVLMKVFWKIYAKNVSRRGKQKLNKTWQQIGYDGVQFQFDCQQWDDVATGVVTGSSLEQAQLLLDCDVIHKSDILKKMEDGRKFHKSKTGLEARFLAPQMYDKGRYKIFRNGQWEGDSKFSLIY